MDTRPSLYDKHFPNFQKPNEVGFFSKTSEREFKNDGHQLKVFAPPSSSKDCCFDLRQGIKDMINRDDGIKLYLNNLLQWIMNNKHVLFRPSSNCDDKSSGKDGQRLFSSLPAEFICWRGLLTRLLCIPFERRDDLMVAVIRFRGTYYMCEFETEMQKREKEQRTERQEEMCRWGWKFEQYVTADPKTGVPDTSQPVNTNAEYGSVVNTKLNSHSLMYGAEIDCYEKTPQGSKYIELKTSRIIEARRQYENFCRFKLIKWWAQSFLIGISKIVCGFRDDEGIVRSLESYNVSEIPRKSKTALRDCWDPSICFNFLDGFLNFVKSKVTEDDEKCVYIFRWQPRSPVQCEKSDDPCYQFLPDWFIEWDEWDKPV